MLELMRIWMIAYFAAKKLV